MQRSRGGKRGSKRSKAKASKSKHQHSPSSIQTGALQSRDQVIRWWRFSTAEKNLSSLPDTVHQQGCACGHKAHETTELGRDLRRSLVTPPAQGSGSYQIRPWSLRLIQSGRGNLQGFQGGSTTSLGNLFHHLCPHGKNPFLTSRPS